LSLLAFIKLGGSVITDKNREATAQPEVIRRLAREIARARAADPGLRLVIGHGSGSFGHFVGRHYGTHLGLRDDRGWEGYARTGAAAARLNRLVTDVFLEEGVPVVSLQPSASARCRGTGSCPESSSSRTSRWPDNIAPPPSRSGPSRP